VSRTVARATRLTESKSAYAPFQCADIGIGDDWRERLVWPIAMSHLRATAEQVCESTLDFVAGINDATERQVAIVAAGRIVNAMMSLAEAGHVAQAHRDGRLRAAGGPPEMAFLLGQAGEPLAMADARRGQGTRDVTRASWPILRTFARTLSWAGLARLPAAVLAPEASALSHNSLLITRARRIRARLRYMPAANVLARARMGALESDPDRFTGLIEAVAPKLIALFSDLDADMRGRVERAFVQRMRPVLAQAGADVLALRSTDLPHCIWRGTGGSYATRVITSEVRRRGGEVIGFDHGGVTGISQLAQLTAIVELMESSAFVVGTPGLKHAVEAGPAVRLASTINTSTILADEGEALFRRACINTKPMPGRKRKVLYVGHPYRGLRQFAIVGTPDAFYWDLQSRIATTIAAWDVDLLCKPHPEGAFVGARNPIMNIAPTSMKRFEEHLAETDVFVFDAPTSTTFAEALCTNRPVVLIERGHYPLNPAVEQAIRARVRTVPSITDERGRIWPDMGALEEAVRGGADLADPVDMRRLFAGVG
jgi:hypothetical protein